MNLSVKMDIISLTSEIFLFTLFLDSQWVILHINIDSCDVNKFLHFEQSSPDDGLFRKSKKKLLN
jgi:hypothetical protein